MSFGELFFEDLLDGIFKMDDDGVVSFERVIRVIRVIRLLGLLGPFSQAESC